MDMESIFMDLINDNETLPSDTMEVEFSNLSRPPQSDLLTRTASIDAGTVVTTETYLGRLPTRMYLTCDDDELSAYQCLLRKQIEFFETTAVANNPKQGRNKPIHLGQVGIRCVHCRLLQLQQEANVKPYHQHQQLTTKGASYFPGTLEGVYQAAQNMASHHFLSPPGECCPCLPVEIQRELHALNQHPERKSGGGKTAWARRARALGVIESDDGYLRFVPLESRS
jgi:hypothetical protein